MPRHKGPLNVAEMELSPNLPNIIEKPLLTYTGIRQTKPSANFRIIRVATAR